MFKIMFKIMNIDQEDAGRFKLDEVDNLVQEITRMDRISSDSTSQENSRSGFARIQKSPSNFHQVEDQDVLVIVNQEDAPRKRIGN